MSASAPLRALLVGVDRHRPSRGPDGGMIPDLSGAVGDALRMRELLRQPPLDVPENRIRMLLSPGPLSELPEQAPEDLPTRRNLVRAIQALGEQAAPGEQVLIHFSGHGVRVPTRAPAHKGGRSLDESLVPRDAGAPDGGVLRDVELYCLLSELAANGLHVTLTLDCCHAGGALRSAFGARIRGLGERTGEWGRTASPVGEWSDLYARLERTQGAAPPAERWRHVHAGSGWFPQPEGCVLLAACRSTERARELPFDGGDVAGALTHCLLEAIGDLGPRPTYRDLHRLLLARIHTRLAHQTPVLEGDGDLRFLGRERWSARRGVTVLAVEEGSPRRIHLATGRAQGVRPGARFGLFPPGPSAEGDGPPVAARVTEVDATTCWAAQIDGVGERGAEPTVDPGWSATLVDAGPRAPRRRIGLVDVEELDAPGRSALARLRARLQGFDGRWLELSGPPGPSEPMPPADLLVTVTPAGAFRVLDPSGEPLPHQGEPIPVGRKDAIDRLTDRLERMARFLDLRELSNPDPTSPLAGGLVLDLLEGPLDEVWSRPDRRRPLCGGVARVGETIGLRIRNEASSALDVVVLDLQPDWGVSIAHPPPDRGAFETLDPGGEVVAPLVVSLPEGFAEGRDVLKALGSTGPLDCSGLELPPLDDPPRRTLRTARPARAPRHDWTEASIEVTVVRSPRSDR